jgi:hypothetical protein
MNALLAADPRWERLLQAAALPFDPAALLGRTIRVDPVISEMNDFARYLELIARSPWRIGALVDTRQGATTGTYFADNVFTWAEGAFHAPRSFGDAWRRERPDGGLLVAPMRLTLGVGNVWNWLVFDRVRGVVHRIDPDEAAKPELDAALRSFLADLPVVYHPPESPDAPYRTLIRDTLIPVEIPAAIQANVWAWWLLSLRLAFPEAAHADVLDAAYGKLVPYVRTANLVMNHYTSFTVDANVHTFGSEAFIVQYGAAADLWRYEALVRKRAAALTSVGSARGPLNQVICAALGDFHREEPDVFRAIYQRYVGAAPHYIPNGQDAGGWVPDDAIGPALHATFASGELRFGYFAGGPYSCPDAQGGFAPDGALNGLDWEIAQRVVARIRARYAHLCPRGLEARWVDVKPGAPAPDEGVKYYDLHQGLVEGRYDVAMSGQLWLPAEHTTGTTPEWTCATTMLVTNITYTGLGEFALGGLVDASRDELVAAAAELSRARGVVLTVFSVVNPGPSPTAAKNLVADILAAGGMARWVSGAVPESSSQLSERLCHFVVGDGIANGWQCRTLLHPTGTYLNIPAARRVTPFATADSELTLLHLAAFTLAED